MCRPGSVGIFPFLQFQFENLSNEASAAIMPHWMWKACQHGSVVFVSHLFRKAGGFERLPFFGQQVPNLSRQHRQFWQFLSEGGTGQRWESSTWEEQEDCRHSWRLQYCFQQRVFGARVQRTDFPEHPECMRHRVMKDPITSEQAFQQSKEKHYTEHIEQTHR